MASSGESMTAVEIEGNTKARHVGGRNQAADDAFAAGRPLRRRFVGLQAIDLAGRRGRCFQTGKQQSRHEMELARPVGGISRVP